MRLNNKLYCDVCCKRIDNYTEPKDCNTYGVANQERHYCKKHNNIGERMRSIYTNEDIDNFEINREKVKEYDNKFKELMNLPKTYSAPPMPPVKPPIKERIKNIYNDDDFTIDLFVEDKMVRVSTFKDGHFKDEVFVKWEDYIE